MKTAKEVCEIIKQKNAENLAKQVKFVISLIEKNNGLLVMRDHYIRITNSPDESDDFHPQSFPTLDVIEKLKELGFSVKITEEKYNIKTFKLAIVNKTRFLGLFPSAHIKKKLKMIKEKTVQLLVISACCGEEIK